MNSPEKTRFKKSLSVLQAADDLTREKTYKFRLYIPLKKLVDKKNITHFVKKPFIKLRTFLRFIKLINIFGLKKIIAVRKQSFSINALFTIIQASKQPPKPKASIVIPTYKKYDLLIKAIASIENLNTKTTYEIVVIDNGNSSHFLKELLLRAENVNYINPSKNLGFVEGCNLGAKNSKGDILVFLNDDTIVLGGWLDELIIGLENEKVGITGSKLVYPDGKLQEAGGIIFNDASGNNYGKFQDTNDFKYNYACNVDYISGASIAIKKALFFEIGMFDKLYAPAYYEDTDLCFKARKAGYSVLYQPRSIVVHYEGATAGTDIASGYKKNQETNKIKFQKKWQKELSTHCKPNDNIFKARTRNYKGRVLFVENSIPEPDKDSGSFRQVEILKILVGLGYHVTFVPRDLVAKLGYTSELQQFGIEVVYTSDELTFSSFMSERANLYDYVFLSRPLTAAECINDVKKYQKNAKIIFDTVDLHYLRTKRRSEIEVDKKINTEANNWETVEKYLIKHADITIVVSPEEKRILEKNGFKNVEVVSNIHENSPIVSDFKKRKDLLFIGNFDHPPNNDAILWFCQEVFPVIRKELGQIYLNIIGSGNLSKIKSVSKVDGVKILGFVKNVKPYFDKSRVFIAPLRYGAGVKGKIGQSISLGLPVVTTSIGAEGMYIENQKDCYIAESSEDFANSVIKLYNDEPSWKKIQKNAQKTIEHKLSSNAAKNTLIKILKPSTLP